MKKRWKPFTDARSGNFFRIIGKKYLTQIACPTQRAHPKVKSRDFQNSPVTPTSPPPGEIPAKLTLRTSGQPVVGMCLGVVDKSRKAR